MQLMEIQKTMWLLRQRCLLSFQFHGIILALQFPVQVGAGLLQVLCHVCVLCAHVLDVTPAPEV